MRTLLLLSGVVIGYCLKQYQKPKTEIIYIEYQEDTKQEESYFRVNKQNKEDIKDNTETKERT